MTWDALHKLAAKAAENGEEKAGKLLTRSFGPYATAFSEAPVLIVCLATPYESKFREKYLIQLLLFQNQFGKKKELRVAV